jgi:hypothetical protein
MRLTALNAKAEFPSDLASEFDREFGKEPAEAIEWAFREWRRDCPFLPAISDIRFRVGLWHDEHRREQIRVEQKREKAEIEVARERGEIVSYPEIVKQLDQVVKRMPDAARSDQRTVTVARREMPPALPLTREEIEKRRPAERAEAERVRREMEGS